MSMLKRCNLNITLSNRIKEYVKRKFDLWNYDEKSKINEMKYIISYLNEINCNRKELSHIDLGGGAGLYAYRLHKEGFLPQSEVVDFYVEQTYGFPHHKVELEQLRLNQTYDIVTCMLVLELVDNRKRIIETIRNLLHKETIVIFSFPNIDGIDHLLWRKSVEKLDNELAKMFIAKQVLFSIDTIKEEFLEYGMEIIHTDKMVYLPVYSTNPRVRRHRKLYDEVNEKLQEYFEPSTVVCVAKLLSKEDH